MKHPVLSKVLNAEMTGLDAKLHTQICRGMGEALLTRRMTVITFPPADPAMIILIKAVPRVKKKNKPSRKR